MTLEESDDVRELLKESIRAADRTTHAVRAIVVPSTILLSSILLAIVPLYIGFASAIEGWFFVSGMIVFIGLGLAISSQIIETSQSAIPGKTLAAYFGNQPLTADQSHLPGPVVRSCECSTWERGVGNTTSRFGVEYCGRCGGEIVPH